MSWTAALLAPVEPDENKIKPGCPRSRRRCRISCVEDRSKGVNRASSRASSSSNASTPAMVMNSAFLAATEDVSGTAMQPLSISANMSAIAFGEKSASMAMTVPVAIVFCRR
jgi:hypothetical protein